MKVGSLKMNAMDKLVAVLTITILVLGGMGMHFMLNWNDRENRQQFLRQKECWKEIYAEIEKGPSAKAEWIKQTITNQITIRGGENYCRALKFIKNGQDTNANKTDQTK